MEIRDINPYIRYSQEIFHYGKNRPVAGVDYRLFYITGGEVDVTIQGEVTNCNKNTLIYCSSGTPYSFLTPPKEPVRFISLNFDLDMRFSHKEKSLLPVHVNLFKEELAHRIEVSDSDFLNGHIIIHNAEIFLPSIREILSESNNLKLFCKEKASALLKNLLIDLHRDNLYKSTESVNAVNLVLDYIKDNYSKDIPNPYLAGLCGYHEYHLNRIFMRQTGVSIHKYISNLRLNEASQLLINTDLSVEAISEKVGFNSNTSFTVAFKKHFDMSPNQYRKEFKNFI